MRTTLLMLLFTQSAVAAPDRAVHHGTWRGDRVAWETRLTASPAVAEVRFAAPLPVGSDVRGSSPLVEDGRIVGVTFDAAVARASLHLTIPQDLDADALAAPVLAGDAVQRVIVDGVSFRPADETGLREHVRYWAVPGADGPARRAFERSWKRSGGEGAHTADQALYLTAASVGPEGIAGRLRPKGWVPPLLLPILAGAGLLALGIGAAISRSLDGLARREQNRVYLDRHFASDEPD